MTRKKHSICRGTRGEFYFRIYVNLEQTKLFSRESKIQGLATIDLLQPEFARVRRNQVEECMDL